MTKDDLAALHERCRAPGLDRREFTHERLWTLLAYLLGRDGGLEREVVGESAQGRALSLIRYGTGPTPVLLVSQTHGDEPTGTMALADLVNLLVCDPGHEIARRVGEELTLLLLPMLNPDGAEVFTRLNAQGIDINRDARTLTSPEGRALEAVHDRYAPAWVFNLHDQEAFKRVGDTDRTAAVSLIPPRPCTGEEHTATRLRARRLCGVVRQAVEPFVHGHVTRYGDGHEPRSFGELLQAEHAANITFEIGNWPDDPQNQYVRKVNFVGLLRGLDAIATGEVDDADPALYDDLPLNGSTIADLVIRGGTIVVPGLEPYRADLSVDFYDPLEHRGGMIKEVGDLGDAPAFETFDASGLYLHALRPAVRGKGGRDVRLEVGASASFVARRGEAPDSAPVCVIDEGRILPCG